MIEQTLVIVKPDGVVRRLVGEVISRCERAGLTLTYLDMMIPAAEQVEQHYGGDPAWLTAVGKSAIAAAEEAGLDWQSVTGVTTPDGVGRLIQARLVDYMTSGPVVVMVVMGPSAVKKVRQLVGATNPLAAAPGSIRGTYAVDDSVTSLVEGRALENIVHASGTVDEAEAEIPLWVRDR